MTRACMDCRVKYGEKCPHCGNEVATKPDEKGMVYCVICDVKFPAGAGGETTGLCVPCFTRRRKELATGRVI